MTTSSDNKEFKAEDSSFKEKKRDQNAPKKEGERQYSDRYMISLTINDNYVFQRYFRPIGGMNFDALGSEELKTALDDIVRDIRNDLESKSRTYMWYVYGPTKMTGFWAENATKPFMRYYEDTPIDEFDSNEASEIGYYAALKLLDGGMSVRLGGHRLEMNKKEGIFYIDGDSAAFIKPDAYYRIFDDIVSSERNYFDFCPPEGTDDKYMDAKRADEWEYTMKFSLVVDGSPIYESIWDASVYPRYVRNGIDMSNTRYLCPDRDPLSLPFGMAVKRAMSAGREDLINKSAKRLVALLSRAKAEENGEYTKSTSYGGKSYRFSTYNKEWVDIARKDTEDKTRKHRKEIFALMDGYHRS